MQEELEVRVMAERAKEVFAENECARLDSVRACRISTSDPRISKIESLQRSGRVSGTLFYYGWQLIRKYTTAEIQSARLFHIAISKVFEPEGEACGTIYDESRACPLCGAGRIQLNDLHLDLRRVPKADLARTIADEWIISDRLAAILVAEGITGFALRPVHHKSSYEYDAIGFSDYPTGRKLLSRAADADIADNSPEFYAWLNKPEQRSLLDQVWLEHAAVSRHKDGRNPPRVRRWYQLIVRSQPLHVSTKTRFGTGPFEDEPGKRGECPLGHVIGHAIISELHIDSASYDGSDICVTKELVGVRRGVLVPHPLLVVSPRLFRLLGSVKAKGWDYEVAYLD